MGMGMGMEISVLGNLLCDANKQINGYEKAKFGIYAVLLRIYQYWWIYAFSVLLLGVKKSACAIFYAFSMSVVDHH